MIELATILRYSAFVLSLVGVWVAARSVFNSLRAERLWVRQVAHRREALLRLAAELEEDAYSSRDATSVRREIEMLAELDRMIDAAFGEKDARARQQLEAALHQPSLQGRRRYARKLVEEGIRGHAGVA